MDPKRFLEGDDGSFETQLVRAARRDASPDGAAQRAAVALGIGAGSAALSSGAGAAGLGAAAGGSISSAGLGLLGIGKWFGIGILSGVIATTGFHYARSTPTAQSERSSATQESARPPRPALAPSTPVALPPTPASSGDGITSAAAEPATPAANPGAGPAPARRPSESKAVARAESRAAAEPAAPAEAETRIASLSAELALLQEARKALVSHDPSRVLAALQRYSSTPRSGLLDSEAEVLRVEALVQAGRRPEAVSLAASALRAAPEGPHAARFRRIMGEGASPP